MANRPIDWRDRRTYEAIERYTHLVMGIALAVLFAVMMVGGRIAWLDFIKAITALLTIERATNGVMSIVKNKMLD